MKTNKTTLIVLSTILMLLQSNCYAQQDSTSKAVKEYWDKIDQVSTYYVKGMGITKKFSDSEVDSLVKIYYRAIGDDPVGYNISRDLEREHEEKTIKENNYNFSAVTPKIKTMRTIRDLIIKKFNRNFLEILEVPYFLKIRIINDSLSEYTTQDPKNFKTPQVNLTGLVEEVIKGNKFFKTGQSIKISFLLFWRSGARNGFKVGKSYFFPLRPWGTNKSYKEITINILPDNNYALYPVENGIISTPGNYFGIGETSSWNSFKKFFTQKYILE